MNTEMIPLWLCIPFAGLLLCIAIMPLVKAHWWEEHQPHAVALWSLLFIIPGIIASYSYAMIPYIQAEHPEMAPSDVLARSKEMMEGNRWRLFCMQRKLC